MEVSPGGSPYTDEKAGDKSQEYYAGYQCIGKIFGIIEGDDRGSDPDYRRCDEYEETKEDEGCRLEGGGVL